VPTSTAPAPKEAGEDQAIGRSKGGLSTKIHVLVDALGNPLKTILTVGQVHDLAGADALVPGMEAEALLADKAYDADKRMIERLEAAGKTAVIPPKKNRQNPRTYDKVLYEGFCCNVWTSAASHPREGNLLVAGFSDPQNSGDRR
jgi:transposase